MLGFNTFNFFRLVKRPFQKGPPPKNYVDVAYDPVTGKIKAIDSNGDTVPFDGTNVVSTDDLVTETSNGSAAAGELGEYVSSVTDPGGAVTLVNNTAANVTSISLTPGDWDVEGNIVFLNSGSTVTQREGCINTTSATRLSDGTIGLLGNSGTDPVGSVALTRKRVSLATTTTVYLVGFALHGGGTVTGFGALAARRVR